MQLLQRGSGTRKASRGWRGNVTKGPPDSMSCRDDGAIGKDWRGGSRQDKRVIYGYSKIGEQYYDSAA